MEASILESAPRRESATRESRESSNAEFDFSRALDAWHYSYTDSLTRARIRAQPEAIFGRDDRVAVADTTVYPSSSICFLKIWLQGGGFGVGTGWLIGRRTVITAGHCVFAQSQRYFGWAQQIEVIPGNAGSSAPFGSFVAPMHSLRSVSGWTEQGRVADDYGAIVLDQDVPAACGFFGFSSLSDAELKPIKVTVRGYPGEESKQGTMWEHSSFLSERQQPRRLLYTIDTTPGQSGSPAFYLDQSVALGLGIHNYGEDMSNFATRINDAVFDDLLAWKNEGGG